MVDGSCLTLSCGGRRWLRTAAWAIDSCCSLDRGAAAAEMSPTAAGWAGGLAKFGISILGVMLRSRIVSNVFAACARFPSSVEGHAWGTNSFIAVAINEVWS